MRALATGATGFLGRRLLQALEDPVVLTRRRQPAERDLAEFPVRVFTWQPEREPAPREAFEGVEAVFHLAGEPVAAGRWTAAKKTRVRDSRVLGTRNLVETITRLEQKPRVLVSASAVGFYGDRGEELLSEATGPGPGFLCEVCAAWERESQRLTESGVRVVNPRIGIVLGRGGGALPQMLRPFQLGLGCPLGSGQQWMPWIHLEDLIGLLLYAASHDALRGPLNCAAPHPVRNRAFTQTLAGVLRRPAFLPAVPACVLRLGLGEFASVLLASQHTVPAAALAAGYRFQFPELEPALRDILGSAEN